jgi:O-antigen ligase
MTSSTASLAAREPLEAVSERRWLGRGWSFYLILALALIPVINPTGPSQLILVDPINFLALAIFFVAVLAGRLPIRFPFALPVFVALMGSVLAMSAAASVSYGVLALVKDAYLYLWFVALVTLLEPRGSLLGVRKAWVWVACLETVFIVVQAIAVQHLSLHEVLVDRRRFRAVGTFTNPNMLADYMMVSIFVLLGLAREVRWWLLAPAFALIVLGMVTTKSNGGLMSLLAGLATWAVAWAWTGGVRRDQLSGVLMFGVAAVIAATWAHAEFGLGDQVVRQIEAHSYMGSMGNSNDQREQIWHRLGDMMSKHPFGIGPKQSSQQELQIGERERPESFGSKEAHDDYLAFLVERGPLGLLGLLIGFGMVVAMVLGARARIVQRLGDPEVGTALWAACVGGLAASSVHSLVIEKLHFRHFWFFFAILTTLCAPAPAAKEPAPAPAVRDARWAKARLATREA